METAYASGTEDVLAHFGVGLQTGLSDERVEEFRLRYGKNELASEPGTPFWKLVLKQFDDLLVKILIIAAIVDFIIALANGEHGAGAFVEPGVIVLILIANATVGVVTETNAEAAIEELKAYEADVATVLRHGRWLIVAASELVPGDIVEIAVGSKIPADIRVSELLSTELRIDQSILTGESESVSKNTEPISIAKAVNQDKTNMLFSGTVVTAGRGRGIVVGTGASTAIGRIRDAMAEAQEQETPLKQKLDQFGTFLSKAIAVICILVWVVNLPHFNDPIHGSWFGGALYYFKIAVALAVAAIPEGLPAVVTTCLALGTRQMAKRNAIVRRLPSVETLGCTTVICSDKTGTLTTNQMSVVAVATAVVLKDNNNGSSRGGALKHSNPQLLQEFEVTGTSFAPEGRVVDASTGIEISHPADLPALLQTAACAALCNDSHLTYSADRGIYQRMGEATEVALRVLAEKIGLPGYSELPSALARVSRQERATYCNEHWEQQHRKVFTLEFDRKRKMMSTLCVDAATGQLMLFCKGAPESILPRCTSALANAIDDGQVVSSLDSTGACTLDMTPDLQAAIHNKVNEFGGRRALRCLALAMRPWGGQNPKPLSKNGHANNSYNNNSAHSDSRMDVRPEDESGLCFVGLVGMQDPPRPEVRSALEQCRAAGVRVIMVTGDNKATAESVCRQIGMLHNNSSTPGRGESNHDDGFQAKMNFKSDNRSAVVSVEEEQGRVVPSFVSLSGVEFDELSGGAAAAAAAELVAFSRVEPAHKSRLVEMLQGQGHIVAMTGDGVNDAPALKRADIGVSMGSGTAVAKHASDMVLADDNFATIVAAVAAGRSIYANTKQFIRYMVSSNIGEVVAIFSAALLGIPECLNPVQLLWVNLVTDGLPATAIGFNKPDADIMRQRPRRADEGIVGRWLFVRYMVVGVYVGAVTTSGFVWWFCSFEGGPQLTWAQLRDFQHCGSSTTGTAAVDCSIFRNRAPSTISMSVLVIVEMFNALNAISENCSLLTLPPWSNPWLLGAISVSVVLHLIILYVPPLAAMFSVTALGWAEWRTVLWLSAPVILVDEVLKAASRKWFSSTASSPLPSPSLWNIGGSGSGSGLGVPQLQLPAQLPGWVHGAKTTVHGLVHGMLRGGSAKDLARKRSGEGLPLVNTQQQRRYHAGGV